jgi:lipoprotein signal peptidase
VIGAVHAALSIPARGLDSFTRDRIFDSALVRFDYLRLENSGAVFGAFRSSLGQRLVPVLFRSLSALALAGLFLSLVPRCYTLQLIALTCIIGPSLIGGGEQLLFGYQLDYFQIGFGGLVFPAFNAADAARAFGWVLLYALVLLRFFRRLPEPRRAPGEQPAFGDPFFEQRKPLRVFLGLFLLIGIPLVLLQCAGVLGQASSKDLFAAVFSLAVNAFTVVLVLAIWFMIPQRPIDALVLRGFAADKRGWPVMRRLRRSLYPDLRLSGVVDPRESRRIARLFYWLLMPFVFGIGDMGRVNAFRYNVFLTDDWQADLKSLFTRVRYAIFDCRTVTPNVAWEMSLARGMFPPERVFFLVANHTDCQNQAAAAGSPAAGLEPAQCFTAESWPDLSKTLLTMARAD